MEKIKEYETLEYCKKINLSKTITLNSIDFKTLESGKNLCVSGINSFINVKVKRENTKDYLIASVVQIGGIFNKSCVIKSI